MPLQDLRRTRLILWADNPGTNCHHAFLHASVGPEQDEAGPVGGQPRHDRQQRHAPLLHSLRRQHHSAPLRLRGGGGGDAAGRPRLLWLRARHQGLPAGRAGHGGLLGPCALPAPAQVRRPLVCPPHDAPSNLPPVLRNAKLAVMAADTCSKRLLWLRASLPAKRGMAVFSDLVRYLLLHKYGGLWCACRLSAALQPAHVHPMLACYEAAETCSNFQRATPGAQVRGKVYQDTREGTAMRRAFTPWPDHMGFIKQKMLTHCQLQGKTGLPVVAQMECSHGCMEGAQVRHVLHVLRAGSTVTRC